MWKNKEIETERKRKLTHTRIDKQKEIEKDKKWMTYTRAREKDRETYWGHIGRKNIEKEEWNIEGKRKGKTAEKKDFNTYRQRERKRERN